MFVIDSLTKEAQLWWDEFQHDHHIFAGVPPIKTCGLMVWLLIKEYYPNDFEEIISCMNQLFAQIYEDLEEVKVQSQNSSIKDVPKKKANTRSIQAMGFCFSPILSVDVASVSLLNLFKFV